MIAYRVPYIGLLDLPGALQWNPNEKHWDICCGAEGVACEMGEDERFGLLEYFELEEWADAFPFERIVWMSPYALLAARRAYEARDRSLPHLELDLNPFLAY